MPYRKEQFVNGEIYHLILRALDDNLIFKDNDDYYRGVFSIYEFNNQKPVSIKERRRIIAYLKKSSRGRASGKPKIRDERDKLVEILAFCFMPNHIHLLVKQVKDGGIIKFMRKVGTGYGGYFNRKYNRKGYVFQNRFSSVHIKDNNQLMIVFTYIHINPISLIKPNWREVGIKNPKEVIKFLESYKWSSYQDYLGKKNFPSVTEREFMLKIMGDTQGCREFVKNWVMYKNELSQLNQFKDLLLE